MNKRLLSVAAAMALAGPALSGESLTISQGSSEGTPMLYSHGGYRSRPGKGKGRRPHHSSKRFVAMDKRDARKARNRSR